MTTLFHLNRETGEISICEDKLKNCLYGADSHFTSSEAAYASHEEVGPVADVRKKAKKINVESFVDIHDEIKQELDALETYVRWETSKTAILHALIDAGLGVPINGNCDTRKAPNIVDTVDSLKVARALVRNEVAKDILSKNIQRLEDTGEIMGTWWHGEFSLRDLKLPRGSRRNKRSGIITFPNGSQARHPFGANTVNEEWNHSEKYTLYTKDNKGCWHLKKRNFANS